MLAIDLLKRQFFSLGRARASMVALTPETLKTCPNAICDPQRNMLTDWARPVSQTICYAMSSARRVSDIIVLMISLPSATELRLPHL